jgi:hypothetical protein
MAQDAADIYPLISLVASPDVRIGATDPAQVDTDGDLIRIGFTWMLR